MLLTHRHYSAYSENEYLKHHHSAVRRLLRPRFVPITSCVFIGILINDQFLSSIIDLMVTSLIQVKVELKRGVQCIMLMHKKEEYIEFSKAM